MTDTRVAAEFEYVRSTKATTQSVGVSPTVAVVVVVVAVGLMRVVIRFNNSVDMGICGLDYRLSG